MEEIGLKKFPSIHELTLIETIYPELDKNSVLIVLTYLHLSKELKKAYNTFFNQYDLTDAKFSVLMILYRAENNTLFPFEIAEQSDISRATVTKLLDGLDKRGLIERKHDIYDRRKIIVILTDEGKRCLERVLPIHYKLTQSLVANFSEEQKEFFLDYLSRLELGINNFRKKIKNISQKDIEVKNE